MQSVTELALDNKNVKIILTEHWQIMKVGMTKKEHNYPKKTFTSQDVVTNQEHLIVMEIKL